MIDSFIALLSNWISAVALFLTIFVGQLTLPVSPPPQEEPLPEYTSPNNETASTSVPTTSSATTSTKKATETPKSSPVVKTPTPPAPAPSAPTPSKTAEQVNEEARAALVNILCTTQAGGSLYPLSGSGVFIDPRGVILTNAHIGQYFLLRDYPTSNNVDCVVRIGNPAQPRYRATLLYLPKQWIDANASQIVSQTPTGTGEDDYALLLITAPTNPSGVLPSSFPALPLYAGSLFVGDQVLLAGYPAGFLDGITIATNLYATSAFTSVRDIFTFSDEGHIDLISIGGTVVSQGGASGGAVVRREDTALAGLIATATLGGSTSERDLRAITLGHINRSLVAAGKGTLSSLLSGDLQAKANQFNTSEAPDLRKSLIDAIEGR